MLNNKETFIEKLNTCGEVKYEMSEVQSRIQGHLKNIYQFIFKREKRDFLTLKNMLYFKGGVASPDARPKLHEQLDVMINLINHYDFLGDDEIKGYLLQHGIEMNVVTPQIADGPIVLSKEDTKPFEQSWKFCLGNEKVPDTKKELLNEIIDRALDTQKSIENKKEEIDKNCVDVELECQVKKSFFMKAIGIKVKEIKKKSVDNEIAKMETDIESSRDIISVFDAKIEEKPEEKA